MTRIMKDRVWLQCRVCREQVTLFKWPGFMEPLEFWNTDASSDFSESHGECGGLTLSTESLWPMDYLV